MSTRLALVGLILATPSFAAPQNPFVSADPLPNQTLTKNLEKSITLSPENASTLRNLQDVSTSVWLDTIANISRARPELEKARAQQTVSGKASVVTFVIYDLPERDCAASASQGELRADQDGMNRYKNDYIAPIAALFKEFSDVRIAAIIEPDSLPNLATNMNIQKCAKAAPIYREGVAHTLRSLNFNNVSMYLDIAHGGWLGWPDNRQKVAIIFKEVLQQAGGVDVIRGFASNVSNYSPTRIENPDLHSADYYDWNPAKDELTFVTLMKEDLEKQGIRNTNFVIDTSRNGNSNARTKWSSWCNIKSAGLGLLPEVNPAPSVDAYLWIKTPGESDGVGDPNADRFDSSCMSVDSLTQAPQAGEWNHEHMMLLLKNADRSTLDKLR